MMVFTLSLSAQKAKRVCGDYTYYAEGNETPNMAKQKALEGAKLQALATEFGTVLSQSTLTNIGNDNGSEKNFISQLSASEVRGEWLEDIGTPEYSIDYVDNMLVVNCKICGKAREVTNEASEFEAKVLQNCIKDECESNTFRSKDNLYVKFKAPKDGYVAIYLIDEVPNAYCLLPYSNAFDRQCQVKGNKEYIFFYVPENQTDNSVDELVITCEGEMEQNLMYILYSPNPFSKAIDTSVDKLLPRMLSYKDFNDWLSRVRKRDKKMGIKLVHLSITSK